MNIKSFIIHLHYKSIFINIFLASKQLSEVLFQVLNPIQTIVSTTCNVLKISYSGIDASINPGLSVAESVGGGIENLLFFPEKNERNDLLFIRKQFGEFGTLGVCMCVSVCVYVRVHVCVCVCIYVCKCAHVHLWVFMHLYVFASMFLDVCMNVHIYVIYVPTWTL